MRKRSRLAALGALLFSLGVSVAYVKAQTQHLPRGTAWIVTHDELMSIKQRSADKPVNDTQVAVLPINNDEFRLAVGIAHRSKASVNTPGGGAVEHSDVTEVYYIISGNGILNTGGTIKDLKEPQAGAPVGPSGPTANGGEIVGGVTKLVGPGDIVVVPPNTPHRFSAINSDEIVYALVRPDPHKVLPTMNLLAK